uniref:Uncharacterized protein n=1 Tax=viral metagenome TaxID=1070528 RepID=A0A6C0KRN6_9ZZZZ
MNHWKWSKGEPYYKSARLEKKEDLKQEKEYDSGQNAISQSLAEDFFSNQDNELISITNSIFLKNENSNGTNREDLDIKMADREMISQRGVNPFLQTSYVNDIVTRDMFLKPLNTSQDRIKNTDT